MLKPWDIWKYLSCLLLDWEKVKQKKVNIDHCYTFYEIGIQKYEFGIERKWKRRNSTVCVCVDSASVALGLSHDGLSSHRAVLAVPLGAAVNKG